MTRSSSRALGADPGEPHQSYSNVPRQTGVDPGKLNERTHKLKTAVTSAIEFDCVSLFEMNEVKGEYTHRFSRQVSGVIHEPRRVTSNVQAMNG